MLSEAEIVEMYRQYGHAIYKRCLRLVHRHDEATELMQETFYQCVKNRKLFEGRSSRFTFLYRIATNLCIDRLRRRKTAGEQPSLDDVAPVESEGQSQEQRAAALEEIAVLTEGWEDSEQLTMAVMAHVDELTHDEIAEQLSVSRRTVSKKLQRLTEAMKLKAGVKV